MARNAKQLAPIMALLTSLAAAAPVVADVETELVMQEIRRLNQRMAQLEADNQRLKSELAAREGSAREKEIVGRLEDVEKKVISQENKIRPLDAAEGIEVEASLLMVGQRALSGTTTGKDESRINYRADVEVSLPAGNIGKAEGELFAHFRIGQGNGLSDFPPTLTSTPNSTAFALSNGDDAAVLLAQAWYELDVPLGDGEQKLEITAGKIDPFGFFDQNDVADDESAAFLNNVFVHNPLLDSGGDMDVDAYGFAPGLIMSYQNDSQSPDYWKATVGVFSSGEDSSFDTDLTHPFVIGQIEAGGQYLLDRPGVYRLYAWNRGRAVPYANESDASRESHSGWGVSANQQVAEQVTVFGRYGHSFEGKVRFDQAITVGAEIGGAYWGREHDRVGLAAGWLNTSDSFRADAPALDADGDGTADFGYSPTGAEKQFEIYYAWQLNEHLELSPDFQWIKSPAGDDSAKDIAIVGLRAKASF
jgi:hypothetical protein